MRSTLKYLMGRVLNILSMLLLVDQTAEGQKVGEPVWRLEMCGEAEGMGTKTMQGLFPIHHQLQYYYANTGNPYAVQHIQDVNGLIDLGWDTRGNLQRLGYEGINSIDDYIQRYSDIWKD